MRNGNRKADEVPGAVGAFVRLVMGIVATTIGLAGGCDSASGVEEHLTKIEGKLEVIEKRNAEVSRAEEMLGQSVTTECITNYQLDACPSGFTKIQTGSVYLSFGHKGSIGALTDCYSSPPQNLGKPISSADAESHMLDFGGGYYASAAVWKKIADCTVCCYQYAVPGTK